MSRSTSLLKKMNRQSQVKPPFLHAAEIKDLAERLHTSQFVVATVLQIAGHVLRERYRRRGWLPAARGEGDYRKEGVARRDVEAAFREVLGDNGYTFPETIDEGSDGRLDLPGPDDQTHKEASPEPV